jgi:DNA-binding Lrp family transcriptional regulator
MHGNFPIDDADRRIIEVTQAGLPLCPEPYAAVAEAAGLPVAEVMTRMDRMLSTGAIRRIGVVPNHYALGYRANGMSVWDVDDKQVAELGGAVGGLEFVSHCYRRPRRLPDWRYNLFAMVHGRDRRQVEEKVSQIAHLVGNACQDHQILYSSQILKKTGLRLRPRESE